MLFDEPDMAAFAASRPLVHEPGTYRQYSSGTTNLICDLLHERTGLGQLADELLFRPLGMRSAVLGPTPPAGPSAAPTCGPPQGLRAIRPVRARRRCGQRDPSPCRGLDGHSTTVVPAGASGTLRRPVVDQHRRRRAPSAGHARGRLLGLRARRAIIVVVPPQTSWWCAPGSPRRHRERTQVDRLVGDLARAVG